MESKTIYKIYTEGAHLHFSLYSECNSLDEVKSEIRELHKEGYSDEIRIEKVVTEELYSGYFSDLYKL
jgi:hypothetical protein